MTGAHKEEIVTIAYNYELSLVATGTCTGEIAVLDYEQSKLLDYAVGHTGEITSINFVWPYPIMITTSIDSAIIIWKVRAVGEDNGMVTPLYKFKNLSCYMVRKDMWDVKPVGITSAQIRLGSSIKGIQREKKNKTKE